MFVSNLQRRAGSPGTIGLSLVLNLLISVNALIYSIRVIDSDKRM